MSVTEFPSQPSGDRALAKAQSRPLMPPITPAHAEPFNWPPTREEEGLIEVIDLGSSQPTSSAGFVALVERSVEPPRVLRVVPPIRMEARPRVPRRGTLAWLSPIAAGLLA